MGRVALWRRRLQATACALSLGAGSSVATAQSVTRPAQRWRTIQTPHFDFHTPAVLEAWTRHVASRMDSYAAAVNAFVGHAPSGRVTVIVDDPTGDANGFAVPLLGEPVIVLWPTPPTPSLTFGEHRDWGEILAIHEYAHVAHLTYPSRNPRERFWWSLLPAHIGPVARRAPAWVYEGFATLVEGRLTGAGRPHSAGRAAVLRQWALAGKLPAYSALDNARSFLGGSMRYLVGSAFLEWLVERKGDASLQQVWRRLSARQARSFDAAFAGVYGVPPADLYGRFVVELTDRALRARDAVAEAGLVEGELFQRLAWNTGEPAVSYNGLQIALSLRQPNQPSRLVIWRTGPEGIDSAVLRRRARILARDPVDVAPFDSFPLPRRADATLRAVAGSGFNNPRWLPDGQQLLVSREVALGSGASRPDLFLWEWRTGRVRRVTHGAGMRFADPAPDGRRAVAVRCSAGRCGLAIVSLADGSWRELVAGTIDVTWHRPRWSPDGRRIAASVQRDGRWQVGVIDPTTGDVQYVLPNDSASRHSPVWVGPSLLVVSDRGGIPNLELLNPETGGASPLTSVLGAVTAPEYSAQDRVLWYLDLHANGLDVRRTEIGRLQPTTLANLPRALAPVSPLPREAGARFDSVAVLSRGYEPGPRNWRYFPGFGAGGDGAYALLAVTNYDPVGRLGVVAQGAYGQRRVWRGGSLGIAWRGWSAFDVTAQGFATQLGAPRDVHNPRFDGGALSVGRTFDFAANAWRGRLGASAARVAVAESGDFRRQQAFVEVAYARRRSHGVWRQLELRAQASGGTSGATDVTRGIASLGATAALGGLRLRLSASGGRVELDPDSSSASVAFEGFTIGGLAPPLFDDRLLPQRISIAALPAGAATGRAYAAYRAALSQRNMPISLYAAWFKLYDPDCSWLRLLGGEGEQSFPSIGFASLPHVTLHYGAAYSVDEPRRHRWTLYAGARFAP